MVVEQWSFPAIHCSLGLGKFDRTVFQLPIWEDLHSAESSRSVLTLITQELTLDGRGSRTELFWLLILVIFSRAAPV